MPVIAVVALLGLLTLPGSANVSAPAETISAPQTSTGEAAEPSKRLATSKEVAQDYSVTVTAYNAVPGQTDDNPFVTASGMRSNSEVVAARSRDMAAELPFGTVIKLERTSQDNPSCRFNQVEDQIGYRIIADTMHERWTKRLDVQLDQNDTVQVDGKEVNPGIAMGVCGGVTATVVGSVDMTDPPTTQAELAAMFAKPTLARR